MRRVVVGVTALVVITGFVLAAPVYASPTAAPVPVETSSTEVQMGSVAVPEDGAVVADGPTEPVAGTAADAPALVVRTEDVDKFFLVGVTWAADPGVTDTVVNIRVRAEADGVWSDWTQTDVEDAGVERGAAGGELRGGTAPVWTGASTAVEAELVTRSGRSPRDVRLDLVDPGSSAADEQLGASAVQDVAGAAVSMPTILTRAAWGADESLRTWAPQYASTLLAATLHHTADTNDYTAEQVPAMMRSIYRYHAVSRGWGDIGYNVVVDRFGRAWEGRYGGLSSTVVGAHAGGFNSGTLGVSMLGNYENVSVPQVVVDAVAAVVAWKFSLYGVDPRGQVTLTSGGGGTSRYPAGQRVTLPTVFGHRDVGATSCPGAQGYARLEDIRRGVVARLASSTTPIEQRYAADATLRQQLGTPVGTVQRSGDVSWQVYQRGRLYDSPSTGVHLVRNAILDAYLAAGGPAVLGAPRTDETSARDGRGAYTGFTAAEVHWSPATGAVLVRNAVLSTWTAAGSTQGRLGYPLAPERAVPGGVVAEFQGGLVTWSPSSGGQLLVGGIRDAWTTAGGAAGALGLPTAPERAASDGLYAQPFGGGELFWGVDGRTAVVRNAIADAWRASGRESGPLGAPQGEESAVPGGSVVQVFAGGRVWWNPVTGARLVTGPIGDHHQATGGAQGPLRLPVGDTESSAAGTSQQFQGGQVWWSGPTGAWSVRNAIGAFWTVGGGPRGPLGLPTTDERALADGRGVVQSFASGVVYWNARTGTRALTGAIRDHYAAVGAERSPLGYPTSEIAQTSPGVFQQSFEGGVVLWSSRSGAHAVRNAVADRWWAGGGPSGSLGLPTTDETPTADGRSVWQTFLSGVITWTPTAGAHSVSGAIADYYRSAGMLSSRAGAPVDEVFRSPDGRGYGQRYSNGWIFWSPTTGAFATVNAIGDRWSRAGGERGYLGYPISDETGAGNGSAVQRFANGELYWTASTGAVEVSGAIRDHYLARGGARGPLGLPAGEMAVAAGGGISQPFAGGVLTWTAGGGVVQS